MNLLKLKKTIKWWHTTISLLSKSSYNFLFSSIQKYFNCPSKGNWKYYRCKHDVNFIHIRRTTSCQSSVWQPTRRIWHLERSSTTGQRLPGFTCSHQPAPLSAPLGFVSRREGKVKARPSCRRLPTVWLSGGQVKRWGGSEPFSSTKTRRWLKPRAQRAACRQNSPLPVALIALISAMQRLPQWERVRFSLRLLERKQPRSNPPSAVSSELHSVISLSERDSVWDQVQSTRATQSRRAEKQTQLPVLSFARRTVCGRLHF